MEFDIKITQVREGFVKIEANTPQEALEAARKLYSQEGAELPDLEDVSSLKFMIPYAEKQLKAFSPIIGKPTREQVEKYLTAQGYPQPSEALIDEFLNGGENQHMYDEAVRNNYLITDLDRWFHLKDVLKEDISYRVAMMIDNALWEEEYEIMDIETKEGLLATEDGIFKSRLETLVSGEQRGDQSCADIMEYWDLKNEDILTLAKAFNLPHPELSAPKQSLLQQIESAENRAVKPETNNTQKEMAPDR